MGHHCIFVGYTKLVRSSSPALVSVGPGGTARRTAEAVVENANSTSVIHLQGRGFCKTSEDLGCLRIGMLPLDRFPAGGGYAANKANAIVGRTPRPDLDPARSHRLRLDRYDEKDFSDVKAAMEKDGLWVS